MAIPSASAVFATIFFGAIGMGAFIYGKRTSSLKPMVIGMALMAYPYFIDATWLLCLIGGALTAAIFIFRD